MITRKEIDLNKPLTEEQKRMLKELETRPVQPDEDCPELTDEQLSQMALIAKQQRADRRKPLMTIRVNPDTLKKAKSLGKGYTGIMGRLLDMAINNPDMLKQCL